jgi:hypothetical protein
VDDIRFPGDHDVVGRDLDFALPLRDEGKNEGSFLGKGAVDVGGGLVSLLAKPKQTVNFW